MGAEVKINTGANILSQIKLLEEKIGTKLSMEEIGAGVGISADYVRKILTGKRKGSLEIINNFAIFLGCSTDEIIAPKNKTMS